MATYSYDQFWELVDMGRFRGSKSGFVQPLGTNNHYQAYLAMRKRMDNCRDYLKRVGFDIAITDGEEKELSVDLDKLGGEVADQLRIENDKLKRSVQRAHDKAKGYRETIDKLKDALSGRLTPLEAMVYASKFDAKYNQNSDTDEEE